MTTNNQAEEKAVETDTTQVESPTTESPITGDKTDGVVSDDQGTVTESSNEPTFQNEEQRRAFQEMRLENKRLKEEAESRHENPFSTFRAQTPPNSQSDLRVETYQDPLTGETNWQAYNLAQQQREQKIIQQARYEASEEVDARLDEDRARSKYPDLMNDPKTEKLIAAQWLWEKTQGRNVSVTDIAGEFARNFKQTVSKAEKVGADRALNEVSEKEQAGLVAESQTSSPAKQAATASDREDLAFRTRKGDEDAITARISKIPWANK